MGIVIFFFYSNLPPDLSSYEVKSQIEELGEKIIPFFAIIWLFIATSMLKGKRKWAERKMKKKAQNQATQSSVQTEFPTKNQPDVKLSKPTIDDELERLKIQIEEEKK